MAASRGLKSVDDALATTGKQVLWMFRDGFEQQTHAQTMPVRTFYLSDASKLATERYSNWSCCHPGLRDGKPPLRSGKRSFLPTFGHTAVRAPSTRLSPPHEGLPKGVMGMNPLRIKFAFPGPEKLMLQLDNAPRTIFTPGLNSKMLAMTEQPGINLPETARSLLPGEVKKRLQKRKDKNHPPAGHS